MIHVYMAHKRYRKEGRRDRYTDFAAEWKTGAWNRFGSAWNVNETRRKSMEREATDLRTNAARRHCTAPMGSETEQTCFDRTRKGIVRKRKGIVQTSAGPKRNSSVILGMGIE